VKTMLRCLTAQELEMVSGGDIVVTGDRPGGNDWWGWDWGSGGDDYDDNDYGGGGGGGSSPPPPPAEPDHDCEGEAVNAARAAIDAATQGDSFNDGSDRQPEYGNTVARDGDGFTVSDTNQGQSYHQSDQPATTLNPPDGFGWSDVVGMVHSHPPSGNSTTDRDNRAPSGEDWLAADEAVNRGADPDELVIYIIDRWGTMRAFEYMSYDDRNASTRNPAGNQSSASDGTVVPQGGDSCSGDSGSTGGSTGGGSGGGSGGGVGGFNPDLNMF